MSTTLTATEDVLSILRAATIDATGIKLNGQLDRKDYEAVNQFLTTAGAAWNRNINNADGSKGRHLFLTPAAHEKIVALLDTGTIRDDKKYFQAFYTPPDIADEMVLAASIGPSMHVLDPSAGTGRLLAAVRKFAPAARLTAIEIDTHRTELTTIADTVIYDDFLSCLPGMHMPADRILMNPPFTALKGIGPQDIAHTLHARKFLAAHGRLVGLCSAGDKQEKALRPLSTLWRHCRPAPSPNPALASLPLCLPWRLNHGTLTTTQ